MKYYKNIKEYILALEKAEELVRIRTPVSRDLEISEIYFRQIRSAGGGRALLFENVEGSRMPVLINAFGSDRRMELAFGGRGLDEIAQKIRELLKIMNMRKPGSAAEMMTLFSQASTVLKAPPRKLRFGRAPCQEIVLTGNQINIDEIPVLKTWPLDGGRFITLGLTVTQSLRTGAKNLGMYRMQVLDKNSTAMHWQIHKDGSHFFSEYREAGRRMPVSVVIGADPSIIFSATAPLPPGINELLLAGFIRGKPVRTVRCITNNLEVPAESEIVIEGYVDPDDFADEGPFGDHTGYYTPVEKFPVFHITAITMRKDPVYTATVVGRSPQEDCYLARATERLFLPMLQFIAPEVEDQMLPWDGCFHNCAVFSIQKHFPFQARRLMSHLWGFSQMSFAKSIVTVDAGVDIHSGKKLLDHILNTIDLSNDLFLTEGILDQLDHSGLRPLYGGKLGVDATTKMTEELPGSSAAGRIVRVKKKNKRDVRPPDMNVVKSALKKKGLICTGARLYGVRLANPVLILSIDKKPGMGKIHEKTLKALDLRRKSVFYKIVIVVPGGDDVTQDSMVLWRLFGNTDPLRDLLFVDGPTGRILIVDCTAKNIHDGYDRSWPVENLMDRKTIRIVDNKWKEMFAEEPFSVPRP